MAQLKDLIVNGASRFIGDIFGTNATFSGDVKPETDNTQYLGDSTHRWKFVGNLTGNADTATGFASAKTISLSGDVSGSASGGNASNGWSITNMAIGSGKVTNAMLAGSIANGKLVNSKVTIAGNDVSLGGSLSAETLRTSLGLSNAMHFIGITSTALSDGATTSTLAEKTSGSLTKTTGFIAGDVVIDTNSSYEYVWTGSAWEALGPEGSYKILQTAISDNTGTADGTNKSTSFIYSFSQNANGELSAKTRELDTSGTWSGNAATATTASKLSNTSKVGDTNKPVYFKADGTPAAISYTIDKSVPSTAVFTDRYVNSASFAHDSTNNNIKMTLTRAGSDTTTVTANIPKISKDTAGVVPKGTEVSSQSQNTKFLREDGTWAAPSYTTNTNTTYTFAEGSTNGAFSVTPSGGSAQSVSIHGLNGAAYKAEDYYVKRSGDTITGNINRYYSATSTDPMITALANNKDIFLFEVGHGEQAGAHSNTNANHYQLKYVGTGASPNNYLQLIASTGANDIVALQFNENGNAIFNGATRFAIGDNDNASNKRFIIGSSGKRYLSFGGAGVQAYGSDDAVGTLFFQYNGGNIQIGQSSSITSHLTIHGNILPGKHAEYNLGSSDIRWNAGYFYGPMLIGVANTGSSTTTGRATEIGPGRIYFNTHDNTSDGIYLRNDSIDYGRLYISTIGTAGDGTNAGTAGVAMLSLGNATAVDAAGETSGANNATGTLRLYGSGIRYSSIKSSTAARNNLFYLPKLYTGTSSATTVYYGRLVGIYKSTTAGEDGFNNVGSPSQPVYVTANGVVTAITGALGNDITGNAATATKIYVTSTSAPSSGDKKYYLTYTESTTSGNQDLKNSARAYVYESTSQTDICAGESGRNGSLTLWNGSYYVNLKPTTLTANRSILLPDKAGTIALTTDITAAIQALDVSSVGATNGTKYIAAISETDGKISATAVDVATTYSSTGTTAISGKGVLAALQTLDVAAVGVDAATGNKYICKISETDGKISATLATATIGGGTQPIWIDGGVIKSTDYALKATVNDGAANYLAYYSGQYAISRHANAHWSDTAGTTSTVGKNELVLGNSTASGTANNAYGRLALYSQKTKGTYIVSADNTTDWYTATLQAKTGTIAYTADITTAIQALDVSAAGATNGTKYIAAISEADGKISATAVDVATTYSATGTTAISGTGVAAALGTLDVSAQTGAASKTLTSIAETDGKITGVTYSDIAIAASQVTSGTLGTARGGTGNTSFTQWGVIYANPATKLVSTAAGTAGYPLIGAGSAAPAWYGGQVNAGTAAASWITTFNGTTASTSTTTGAVKIAGGLGVAGQVTAARVGAGGSNTSYALYANGNTLHNGIVYFANGTTYYINNSAVGLLNQLNLYNNTAVIQSGTQAVDLLYSRIDTRAGTSGIGSNNYTLTTVAGNWGNAYCRNGALKTTYNTAGDINSGVASTSYYNPKFWWRIYSVNTSTGARINKYEDYSLPECNPNRTGNGSFNILTTKAAVTVAQGGTGKTSWTAGKVIYASAATTLAQDSAVSIDGTKHVLMGAAWNDYAEYRITKEAIEPGRCIKEAGDDTLKITTKRLERGCEIVSDTFGFAIGETEESKTPIASSGRVLAYPYESREEFAKHIGWPVCSGPNGTVSIMTEEEEEKYPSRIIGTISAVPDYEEWGATPVKVNGRVWIRIR